MPSIDVTAIPPLQVFSWLSTYAFGGGGRTQSPTPEALRLLGHYLQSQSCNLGEVEMLKEWQQQNKQGGVSLKNCEVDLETVERAVATRAAAVYAVLGRNEKRATVLASTAPAGNTANRCGGSGALQEGDRGPNTSVVQWWRLGSGSPWDFALSVNDGSEGQSSSSDYRFVCLRDAIEVIEPFLNKMRCAAALGAEDAVSPAYQQGQLYISAACMRGEPTTIFASLELARTYVTVSFGDRAGVAAVARALQACRAFDELRHVAAVLKQLDSKEADTQDARQQPLTTDPTSSTLSKAQAYWSLTTSYSVFFHTVAAYVDGVTGKFDKFAAAVLGTGDQPDLHLWGAARFPFIPFAVAENDVAVGYGGEANRNASRSLTAVHTRLTTLFPFPDSHVTGSAADYYLAEYKPLVAAVMAPARSFATLLILSAVATLPLRTVMAQVPMWAELRELYENCDELETLLRALNNGELGVAWRWANEAATHYLTGMPQLSPSVLDQLLEGVRKALCFHYMKARNVTNMAHAAADLCFDSTKEFIDAVTALIQDQWVDARIDLVSGTVQVQRTDLSATDGERTREAAARAVLGLSTLEMQVTCMSAERNLIFVPASQSE